MRTNGADRKGQLPETKMNAEIHRSPGGSDFREAIGEPVLVPAPREARWGNGVCRFAEGDIRHVRNDALPTEGYRIEIAPDGVTVASADDAGAFYALRTLRQATFERDGNALACRCGTISDAPAFHWRGLMLDEARHFFGKGAVKDLLDLMADHKLNVFHWHLVDDQGWRLALDRFPELVQYGAVRPESPKRGCRGIPADYRGDGQPYGPFFYTPDDIREILAYAAERFIRIVPEIELPGHIRALLAAHPEFACREGVPRVPYTKNGWDVDVLCAGNDAAIAYMERVFDEVCELFPDKFVHFGGDECCKKRWKECPKCQARIKALGLADEDALQAWVTRHFTDYLARKGRRAVGWEEILHGETGRETVVQTWRDREELVPKAASLGHDVVVSAHRETYFSRPQGVADDPFTYFCPNVDCTLATVYAFDPFKGVADEAKGRILGAECCLWSECVWNEYDLAFKLWPRTCALAEAVWTAPGGPRDFAGFHRRMETHRRRLIAAHVNCAPLE